MLVSTIIIYDEMQIEMGRGLGINLLKEPDELLMPMPGHAVTDNFPVNHV